MKSKAELLESSSNDSLSEDDEDGWMLTEEVEKEFYKTLSQIKNKDPKIYKKEVEFFKDVACPKKKENNSKKSAPLTLRDYERKLVLEKGGELSDEEPLKYSNSKEKHQPTYVEEQETLKKSLKSVLNDASEDEDQESWGGLFKKREKTQDEKEKEDKHYKEWLKGQKDCASDEEIEKNMQPLRDYWTDPNLNKDEKFLRDYVLNKKFVEHGDENEDLVNGRIVLEESDNVNDQDEYEHKYNHRFEEPDQEFIKRYPRVMENSVRRKNDHRSQKRIEVKDRKLKEKEKKRAEIKHKKKLKKIEIEEKIEELKKLTGNDQLAFEDVLNQDFDIDDHDKAMKKLFSEEFYSQDDPNFNPGYDEEPWNEEEYEETEGVVENAEPLNCEDPNFNMDCDYDPTKDKPKPTDSRSRRRKDKHRRTTVSEAINREKPKFDPAVHQSFKDYVDQYYAIDCEDFIGDLPCRFKYRQTVPNSYGLTIEEILAADDKELDRWCSIKRIQQLRPEYKEKCDIKVYKKKGADENLKRKILPSLYKTENPQDDSDSKEENNVSDDNPTNHCNKKEHVTEKTVEGVAAKQKDMNIKNKNKHKKKNNKQNPEIISKYTNKVSSNRKNKKRKSEYEANDNNNCKKVCSTKNSKSGKWSVNNSNTHTPSKESNLAGMSDARLLAYGIKPKKFRNKLKYKRNLDTFNA